MPFVKLFLQFIIKLYNFPCLAKSILEIDNQSNKKVLKGNVKKKYENFKKGVYRIVGENDKINSILDDKKKIRKLFRRMRIKL